VRRNRLARQESNPVFSGQKKKKLMSQNNISFFKLAAEFLQKTTNYPLSKSAKLEI
jgi:hypothetical protein